jgi:hypothetical protein
VEALLMNFILHLKLRVTLKFVESIQQGGTNKPDWEEVVTTLFLSSELDRLFLWNTPLESV